MEPPAKRARIHEEVDVHEARRENDLRLKSRFEDIFKKYGRDFDTVGDEIDLETGEITVNNGHLQEMDNEQDVGRGLWDDFHPDDDDDVDDGSERENPCHEEETSPTQPKTRKSTKKPKGPGVSNIDENIPPPLGLDEPDLDPVWETPDIETRFTSASKLTTPAPKQTVKPRSRSPPNSGSIWASSQKKRRQSRRIKRQDQHGQASSLEKQQGSRESPDSDDPLNDGPVSTPAKAPSLIGTDQFNTTHPEVTKPPAKIPRTPTTKHQECLTQSVEQVHGEMVRTTHQLVQPVEHGDDEANETGDQESVPKPVVQVPEEMNDIADQELLPTPVEQDNGDMSESIHQEPLLKPLERDLEETDEITNQELLPNTVRQNHGETSEITHHKLLPKPVEEDPEETNESMHHDSPVDEPEPSKQPTTGGSTMVAPDLCEVVIFLGHQQHGHQYPGDDERNDGEAIICLADQEPEGLRTDVPRSQNTAPDPTPMKAQAGQEELIPSTPLVPSKTPTKNRSEPLSAHEVKIIVDLRFLQKLSWRKVLDTSALSRPSARQLKELYNIRDNILAGNSSEDSPPWTEEEKDVLKCFLPAPTTSWDEIQSFLPDKSIDEIQHEWIRICLEQGNTVSQNTLQLEDSHETLSTPSKRPNDDSAPQVPSTPQQQSRTVDYPNAHIVPEDNGSNRSESPDPLAAAFETSWIGAGLSTMQIDTPPRPLRSKGNSISPSKGSIKSSARRSSRKFG